MAAAQRLRAAARELEMFAAQFESGAAVTRESADAALAEAVGAARALFGLRPRAKRGEGGQPRLEAYFRAHVGQWLSGEELQAAAGFITTGRGGSASCG